MTTKKKTLAVVFLAGLTVFLVLVLIINPKKIIKRKIGLVLPPAASITNYSYNWNTGSFEAKILLD